MRQSTRFPDRFLWGASTASHQVEGGNRWNDWWQFEQRGQVPHRSGSACEFFERYAADFDMAQAWGHNAHRFSIEWSRIEPSPGQWNNDALGHYARVIDALHARGIEPLVTLHHFTNPAWFTQRGGWARGDSAALFARYVEVVLKQLGNRVRYWITINEATVYVKRAYIAGTWPPCRSGAWWQAVKVFWNLARAHRVAYAIVHRHRPDAMVGIAHSAPYVEASNPARIGDRCAARLRNFVLNRLQFWLLRGRSGLALDFIGLNYYARERVRWAVGGLAWLFGVEDRNERAGERRRYSGLGWEIHAPGLAKVLHEFSRYRLPLMVTENGIATDDEAARSEFLQGHLEALAGAVRAGIDVRGYCYWSLLDNFEWAEGFAARFGLAAVDFATQRRIARPAALLYAAAIRQSAVSREGAGQ